MDATVFSSSPTSETDSSGKPRYQGRISIAMVFLFVGIYEGWPILHQNYLVWLSEGKITVAQTINLFLTKFYFYFLSLLTPPSSQYYPQTCSGSCCMPAEIQLHTVHIPPNQMKILLWPCKHYLERYCPNTSAAYHKVYPPIVYGSPLIPGCAHSESLVIW